MKFFKAFLLFMAISGTALSMSACRESDTENAVEDAGESVEESVDDAVEDAAE